jgi:hypothetical protein
VRLVPRRYSSIVSATAVLFLLTSFPLPTTAISWSKLDKKYACIFAQFNHFERPIRQGYAFFLHWNLLSSAVSFNIIDTFPFGSINQAKSTRLMPTGGKIPSKYKWIFYQVLTIKSPCSTNDVPNSRLPTVYENLPLSAKVIILFSKFRRRRTVYDIYN